MTASPTTTAPFTLFTSRSLDTAGTDRPGGELELMLLADDRILLTVPDAAHRLGISRSLLYELLAAGEVESIHVGRLRRIPADALAAYVARLRRKPPEPVARTIHRDETAVRHQPSQAPRKLGATNVTTGVG